MNIEDAKRLYEISRRRQGLGDFKANPYNLDKGKEDRELEAWKNEIH